MLTINANQQKILLILLQKEKLQSSDIHRSIADSGIDISLITVKRELSEMTANGLIFQNGAGRYVNYSISPTGRIFVEIDSLKFSAIDPDIRYGMSKFNFELFNSFPKNIFTASENAELKTATLKFLNNSKNLTPLLAKKELERLVIELSWKSSKIEGNTYTLLDTEKLIRENQEAVGHSKQETLMILNHKKAFDYIWNNKTEFKKLSKKGLEDIHGLLIESLGIQNGYRKGPVGVTGSKYKPIDNVYQIEEAMNALYGLVNKTENPYEKALIALAGISYIQPFEDGNKRLSRLITNALLLAHNLAPLSYRSVDENNYRAAMLTFYELNSLMSLKKIFIEQYLSASSLYSLSFSEREIYSIGKGVDENK